jgi:hypothetical protein
MFLPYRPFLENLEKREVFSAGPLAGVHPLPDNGEAILAASTYGRGLLAANLSHDANVATSIVSPRDAASGLPTSARAMMLPYLEQDNIYKLASHDAVFQDLRSGADLLPTHTSREGIIAILIG